MSEGRRVLVCGGRNYAERRVLGKVLDAEHEACPIRVVITGEAAGADRLAKAWAQVRKITVMEFPANWHHQGRAAGPIRNADMIEVGKPDVVIAFPGGRGTQDMKAKAPAAVIRVIQAAPDKDPAFLTPAQDPTNG